ncbi:MAG: DUF423 domain-containing protein [Micropepsaceae bacterium]
MAWAWTVGALHGLIGSAILFLSIHPLRDALDEHSLQLAVIGSAVQAIQGLALLVLSRAGAKWPAILIAIGTTAYTAMLYFIIFTGQHPFDAVVPAGGMVMLLGWIVLVLSPPKT